MNRFAAIHQFHAGTAQGDAITQQMLHLRDQISQMGVPSEIFAEYVAAGLQDRIQPIGSYRGSERNLLLVHHSLGNAVFDDLVGLPDEIVAVYHNVTPERYFTDDAFRRLIRLGHEQLALLARRARVGIADSNYNRREMLAVGFRRVEVMPPRVDYSQFDGPTTDPDLRSKDWLYVGRIVGNKCQHDLVRAFALYARSFGDDDARLVLIGDTSVRDYVALVQDEAARLGISRRVTLLGKVSEPQLKSAFAGAGVFVSLSEHEGFGVPILEAMAAGLPVVAFGAAAVPEIMGGAGVLLRNKDPEVVAATVQALRADPEFRSRLVARQFVRVQKVQEFDVPALLKRVVDRASGRTRPYEVQVQGPFETSYSLAVMNRELACRLDGLPDRALSIYATEGPGDYEPDPKDLAVYPAATALFHRSRHVPYPDAVIRQMYPPRVIDSPGGITCEYFGWEESRLPQAMVDDFNRYLAGVGVMSRFVRDVLRDSGVDVPVRVVGIGVVPHDPSAVLSAPELDRLRSFRFLHISSAFPRKGVDVLLKAYFSTFDGSSDVTLILKTFPNPHNDVGPLLERMRAQHPNPPDVRWIDRDLADAEVKALYNLAHCYVQPAPAEGLGLPVAEAMAARVPVDQPGVLRARGLRVGADGGTLPFRLEPARTDFEVPTRSGRQPDRGSWRSSAPTGGRFRRRRDAERVQRAHDLITSEFSWRRSPTGGRLHRRHGEDAVETRSKWRWYVTWHRRGRRREAPGRTSWTTPSVRLPSRSSPTKGSTSSTPPGSSASSGTGCTVGARTSASSKTRSDCLTPTSSTSNSTSDSSNSGGSQVYSSGSSEHRGVVVTLHRTKDIEIEDNSSACGRSVPRLEEGRSVDRPPGGRCPDTRGNRIERQCECRAGGVGQATARLGRRSTKGTRIGVQARDRNLRVPASAQRDPRAHRSGQRVARRAARPLPGGVVCPLSRRPVRGVRRACPGGDRCSRPRGQRHADHRLPARRCGASDPAWCRRNRAAISAHRGVIECRASLPSPSRAPRHRYRPGDLRRLP